nr:hypothetical protein [Tanacetum cinerariifolium]
LTKVIKTHNLGVDCVKEARLQTLIKEFDNMNMSDNDTIDAYAAKLSNIASKSATFREVMSEHKMTTRFEDVVGRLKVDEERVKEEDKADDAQENLPYARTEYSNGNNDSIKGRGRVVDEEVNPHNSPNATVYNSPRATVHSSLVTVYATIIDEHGSDIKATFILIKRNADGSIMKYKAHLVAKGYVQQPRIDFYEVFTPAAQLETIRLLIALAAGKGLKIHHLNVKTDFLHGDIKLNNTLKEMDFQQCMQEKAVYRKVSNEEFIIVAVYVGDLFVTKTNLDLINEFKKRMASQFKMSDLGTTLFGFKYNHSNDMRLMGYSSHNVLFDDGQSTTRHVFYLATTTACQVIWLRDVLAEVTDSERVIVEHVSGENQRADPLTKALVYIRFKEMRSLLGVKGLPSST